MISTFPRCKVIASGAFIIAAILFFAAPHSALAAYTFGSQFGTSGSGNGQFDNPDMVAIDSAGDLYVVDEFNNRVEEFSSTTAYIGQFGTAGTGTSQFSSPTGIAIDSNGKIYVVDTGNNRIEIFSSTSTYIGQFGGSGSGNGKFNQPKGVAIDPWGNIYVIDSNNGLLQKFSSTTTFISQTNGAGTGSHPTFGFPVGLTIDSSGNVYVVDQSSDLVQKFSSTTAFVTQWGGSNGGGYGQFIQAASIGIDPSNNIYVGDAEQLIQKFTSSGVFLGELNAETLTNGAFESIPSVAFDKSYNIYSAAAGQNFVAKFISNPLAVVSASVPFPISTSSVTFGALMSDSGTSTVTTEGFAYGTTTAYGATTSLSGSFFAGSFFSTSTAAFLPGIVYHAQAFVTNGFGTATGSDIAFPIYTQSQFGGAGSGTSTFASPAGTAVDKSGNIYVVDTGNYLIQKFSPTGAFILQWGSAGSGTNGTFSQPQAIAVDTSGNVYVTDLGHNLVDKFSSSGGYISQFNGSGNGHGGFNFPEGIAVDATGTVYVADTFNNLIEKYSSSGTFMSSISGSGNGFGSLSSPSDVAVDAAGNIYVADANNNALEKFNSSGTFITKVAVASLEHIGIDASGNLYVTTAANLIKEFNPSFNLVAEWGGAGSGKGLFSSVSSVAANASGSIYVTDAGGNDLVQKFQLQFAPQTPGSVTAAAGTGQAGVSWAAPSNGGSSILYYSIASNPAGFSTTTASTTTSVIAAGLSNGISYTFNITASNAIGTSTAGVSNAVTPASLPTVSVQAPLPITSTGATLNGTITLTGGVNPTISGFNYGPTIGYGLTTSSSGSFGTGTYNELVSGLLCNALYHVQAYVTNTAGTATSSDTTFTTNACPVAAAPVTASQAGGSVSASVLESLLAPSAAATAYLNTIGTAPVLGCPAGYACTPIASSAPVFAPVSVFTQYLSLGMTGNSVKNLQVYLNTHGYTVATSGPGSSGHETSTFGSLTKKALASFQKAHGISATGYFGPVTEKYVDGH